MSKPIFFYIKYASMEECNALNLTKFLTYIQIGLYFGYVF